jgi:hypothetical protein
MLIGFFVMLSAVTALGVTLSERVDRPRRRAAREAGAEQAHRA